MTPLGYNSFKQAHGTLRKVSGTKYWTVDKPFIWWINFEEKTEKIIVPRGFRFDFGSVPRLLWFILPPTDWIAYTIHDYTYSICFQDNRALCDRILLQALIVEGCPLWQASLIYAGVRIGGWYTWRKCRNDLINKK